MNVANFTDAAVKARRKTLYFFPFLRGRLTYSLVPTFIPSPMRNSLGRSLPNLAAIHADLVESTPIFKWPS